MPTVEASIVINASVDEVFAVMDDPQRVKEYMPGVTQIYDYDYTPQRVGDQAMFVYSVLGLHLPTKVVIREWERNRWMVMDMDGGLKGILTFSFVAYGGFTRVSWHIDYTMKGGILGKAVNTLVVEWINRRNAERALRNLKHVCEAANAPVAVPAFAVVPDEVGLRRHPAALLR